MHKIYQYNNQSYLKINDLQKKKIKLFQDKIDTNEFKLIKNDCLCGLKKNDILISSRDKYGIKIFNYLCQSCGLIRQDPVLDENSLMRFYQKFYREIYEGQEHDLNFERIFSSQEQSGVKIYNQIKKILVKNKLEIKNYNNVLEIGCGPGGILNYFKSQGHDVTGVDFDNNYEPMIKKKNINFVCDNFLNKNFTGKYDVIVLSHVIEHFLDINSIIIKLNDLLKSNGVLYILTPGIFKFENYKLLNLTNEHERTLFLFYIQNAHLFYFTLNSLKNVFNKFKDIFSFEFGDEEIQAIYFKKKDLKNTLTINDYKKIIRFYNINYYRFLLLKPIRVPFKIMFKIGIKIKKKLGIRKKIFK